MLFSAFILLVLLVCYFFVIGSPLAVSRTLQTLVPAAEVRCGVAALGGFVAMVLVATVLTRIGLPSGPVFMIAPVLAAGLSLLFWYRQGRPRPDTVWSWRAFGPLILLIVGVIIVASFDLDRFGIDHYIPLTNDDTFSYFGHIDQIREAHKQFPSIVYPAGYAPVYQHATTIRVAAASFCAGLADLMRLETHAAFFLTLRLCYVMATLGVVTVIGLLGRKTTTAVGWGLVFAASNLMMHQVYQQFLSSAVGVVCELGIVIAALITIRAHFNRVFVLCLGITTGVMAMASPEAHPFLVLALMLFALMELVVSRQRLHRFSCLPLFLVGFATGCAPVLPDLFHAVFNQGSGALAGHPGDWFANKYSLFQATGLFFISLDRWLNHTSIFENIGLALVLVLGAVGSVSLVGQAIRLTWRTDETTAVMAASLRWLAAVTIVYLGAALKLYAMGRGYAYLKVLDYFCFMPLLLVHFGWTAIASRLHDDGRPSVSWSAGTVALSIFLYACLTAKVGEATRYQHTILATRDFDTYRFSEWSVSGGPPRTILLDVAEPKLNLVLYLNRYGHDRLVFTQQETWRYVPPATIGAIDQVFRLGYMDPRSLEVMRMGYTDGRDINRRQEPIVTTLSDVVPADGYVKLVYGPDSHWLPPEGDTPALGLRRWLSQTGGFILYQGTNPAKTTRLHVELLPGPDLDPHHHIVITVGGVTVANLDAAALPAVLDLPLEHGLPDPITDGDIRIEGPHHGLREVRVGALYTRGSKE